MMNVKWVTIAGYCELHGCTPESVRAKILNSAWREGERWLIAPDGDILIDARASLRVGGLNSTGFRGAAYLRRNAVFVDAMPTGSGIYFLMLKSQVQYVGQATGLMRRIGQHMYEQRIKFDRVSWISCERDQLDRMERAYINLLQPLCNLRGVERLCS